MSMDTLIGKLNTLQSIIESPRRHELKHDEALEDLLNLVKANDMNVILELNEYGHGIWSEA